MLDIGVLALQGDVAEHISATLDAGKKLSMQIRLKAVRNAEDLSGLHGLILPGGESTTLSILLVENNMLHPMRSIPGLLGTCAGLILMAKEVEGKISGQQSLGVLDAKVDRNAYGSQVDSFESTLDVNQKELDFGDMKIPFIRAPRITRVGESISVLAWHPISKEPVIVQQKEKGRFYLGATCHPEMKTSKMHQYFLKQLQAVLEER